MTVDPIDYLDNEIRISIENDIRDVALYHARRRKIKKAGHFGIPRNVFCFVDHLGSLAYGASSTENAVKFIREFFPVRYHNFAALLYAMWRHGTVHEYKPKSFCASCAGADITVRWLSTNHNRKKERAQNMLPFPMEGKSGTVYLKGDFVQKLRFFCLWCRLAFRYITQLHRLQVYRPFQQTSITAINCFHFGK